ncbi:acyl-CoA-like ligand-binding transcription factor [Streptomyces sp. UC1A3]
MRRPGGAGRTAEADRRAATGRDVRLGCPARRIRGHSDRQPPPERALELSRLIFDTPSLRSRYIEKRLRWQAELVPVVRARLGDGPGRPAPDTQAKAIVATVFACIDTATELWAGHDGRFDLADLYDQCLAAVRDHG